MTVGSLKLPHGWDTGSARGTAGRFWECGEGLPRPVIEIRGRCDRLGHTSDQALQKGHVSWTAGPWALVTEGGVIPLQLGLPGATLLMSAHPFFLLLFTVIRAIDAGAYVFCFLLLSFSLIFPTSCSFMFLDARERKEILIGVLRKPFWSSSFSFS